MIPFRAPRLWFLLVARTHSLITLVALGAITASGCSSVADDGSLSGSGGSGSSAGGGTPSSGGASGGSSSGGGASNSGGASGGSSSGGASSDGGTDGGGGGASEPDWPAWVRSCTPIVDKCGLYPQFVEDLDGFYRSVLCAYGSKEEVESYSDLGVECIYGTGEELRASQDYWCAAEPEEWVSGCYPCYTRASGSYFCNL